MAGKTLSFTTTASGAVSWSEGKAADLASEKEKHSAERKGRGKDVNHQTSFTTGRFVDIGLWHGIKLVYIYQLLNLLAIDLIDMLLPTLEYQG
jgi:hypothetical protein